MGKFFKIALKGKDKKPISWKISTRRKKKKRKIAIPKMHKKAEVVFNKIAKISQRRKDMAKKDALAKYRSKLDKPQGGYRPPHAGGVTISNKSGAKAPDMPNNWPTPKKEKDPFGRLDNETKKEGQVAKATIIGAAVGAVAGAASAEKSKKKSALKGAVAGGMLGAGIGSMQRGYRTAGKFSGRAGGNRSYSRSQGPFRGNVDKDLSRIGIDPATKKKFTKKKDVKKMHRRAAFKHHPDRGGDADKMSKINQSWERISNSTWYEKLAFLKVFRGLKHIG